MIHSISLSSSGVTAVTVPLLVLTLAGCLQRGPEAIEPVAVDAPSAAALAIELYDTDHDGVLDETELAASPALTSLVAAREDASLSQDKITTRLGAMFTGTSLLGVECQVLLDGRPLSQAIVRLIPAEIFGDAIQPAEGVTDESGIARPTIASEDLPKDLRGSSLIEPGLYRVEITHAEVPLPSRYNSTTELGMAVDPSQRGGDTATFRLKAK